MPVCIVANVTCECIPTKKVREAKRVRKLKKGRSLESKMKIPEKKEEGRQLKRGYGDITAGVGGEMRKAP